MSRLNNGFISKLIVGSCGYQSLNIFGFQITCKVLIHRKKQINQMKVILNGYYSRSLRMNAGVAHGSILGPTLLVIFINTLFNLLSLLMTIICIYRYRKSDHFDMVKLVADPENELQSVVNLGKGWRVNFNATKIYLLYINLLIYPTRLFIRMADANLQELDTLRHLGWPEVEWAHVMNLLLALLLRKVVHCVMWDNLSFLNLSCISKSLLFFFASNIASTYGLLQLPYI